MGSLKKSAVFWVALIGIATLLVATYYWWFVPKPFFPSPPSTADFRDQGDLDNIGGCNELDELLFNQVLGQCRLAERYNTLADADHDGCITEKDRALLFPCKLA